MSVGSRAEKFNRVSNNDEHKQKYNFTVFEQKNSFWGNLVPKFKIA